MSTNTFLFNGVNIVPPSGSIMPYMGITNPAGWILCDGQTYTVSDGSLQALAGILNTALNVTTNTGNSVTVPDLRDRFLRGRSSITNNSANSGNPTVTLTENNMPSHTHTITDPGHTHFDRWLSADTNTDIVGYAGITGTLGGNQASYNNTTGITINSTGGGQSFPIIPPCYTINYIIKI